MKPHEQDWEGENLGEYPFNVYPKTDGKGPLPRPLGSFWGEGNAKLAAQAPAMARLLLQLRAGGAVLQRGDDQIDQIEAVLRSAGVIE